MLADSTRSVGQQSGGRVSQGGPRVNLDHGAYGNCRHPVQRNMEYPSRGYKPWQAKSFGARLMQQGYNGDVLAAGTSASSIAGDQLRSDAAISISNSRARLGFIAQVVKKTMFSMRANAASGSGRPAQLRRC